MNRKTVDDITGLNASSVITNLTNAGYTIRQSSFASKPATKVMRNGHIMCWIGTDGDHVTYAAFHSLPSENDFQDTLNIMLGH